MSDRSLTLLLGAESLLGPRSGIGRMTWQIAHVMRDDPRVSDVRLLIGAKSEPVADIDTLAKRRKPLRTRLSLRARIVHHVPPLLALRRVVLRQRLARHLAAVLPSGRDGAVYHEPNMIARPYDGTTMISINDLSWHHHRDFHPADRIAWIERGLPRSLKQARRVVAISEFTKSEIVR